MPESSPIFGLSIAGTGASVVALIAAAIALRRAGASRGPFILPISARVFLMGGRPFPAGTLAFGCFFLGAAWLEFGQGVRRTPDIAQFFGFAFGCANLYRLLFSAPSER